VFEKKNKRMTILVTGSAGFIGHQTARALLEKGETVIGADNLNDYYDVALKNARLAELTAFENFQFENLNIEGRVAIESLVTQHGGFSYILHLAA
jgi:UDP-glucuronate 4-epimerase